MATETKEPNDADQNAAPHAPKPETVDQSKSAVTAEEMAAFQAAAPQPHMGEEPKDPESPDPHDKKQNDHGKQSSHAKHK